MSAGPEDGPVVILLHGFPEFSYGWRKQIEPLATAGFHVIAPDQRGYNRSSKPADVGAYRLRELTADVIAIGDQARAPTFSLVGHDWGAAVAWHTAMKHPDRVAKLAILNVPHPAAMMRALRTNTRQMLRSWYMLFFQIPRLPEFLISRNGFQRCVDALRKTSRPGTFTDEDFQHYREAWSQPEAMTAMINWYRAITIVDGPVTVPTRILWGTRDAFLVPELARKSMSYCDHAELFEFPNATHWLQHEEPEQVNKLLIDFFS